MTGRISSSALFEQAREGPLGPYVDGFTAQLVHFGYAPFTILSKLRVMGYLGDWLARLTIPIEHLDESKVGQFKLAVDKRWSSRGGFGKSLNDIFTYLRELRVVPAQSPASQTDSALKIEQFNCYLTEERGLAPATRSLYCQQSERFLAYCFPSGQLKLSSLSAGQVTSYVLAEASRMSPKGAGNVVGALRSLLRFFHVRGDIEMNLAGMVPAVLANRRQRGVPLYLRPDEIKRVLDSCNRETAVGRRDYAIMLTLSRLGLRGGEIVRLAIDDLDWQRGELRVCGRPGRTDLLPLPVDVGAAIADYLRNGRPQCTSRRVFIRAKAPFIGFPRAMTVANIIRKSLKRANLDPPRQGAGLLRHTVATELLRSGLGLAEIGELLRHRHADTTSIYARVDLAALRDLTLPWPEVIDHE